MNISCDIIKDVLPLYAEDLASQATRELVEEHLCSCEGCTKELEGLRKPAKVPVEIAIDSLKRVGDSIRRRRILAVMAAFLFIATVLIGGALMLDATIYLSAEDAVKDIYVEGDSVKIIWNDYLTGVGNMSNPDDQNNFGVIAVTNLCNLWFPYERVPYDQLADDLKDIMTEEEYNNRKNTSTYHQKDANSETNFWYVNPWTGEAETLLLYAGKPHPEQPLTEVRYHTAYLCIGLLILCAVLALLGKRFSGRWYGELCNRFAIIDGSFALSLVIVSAGQFVNIWGAFTEHVIDAGAVAVPMTLFGLCLRQLLMLNRQDKGF